MISSERFFFCSEDKNSILPIRPNTSSRKFVDYAYNTENRDLKQHRRGHEEGAVIHNILLKI